MTKKTLSSLLLALALAACGGPSSEGQLPDEELPGSQAPGGSIDLNAAFASALRGAPTDQLFWNLAGVTPPEAQEAAVSTGLLLTQGGQLFLPGCSIASQPGGVLPVTITVQAMRGASVLLTASLVVDETFVSSAVVCAVPSGATTCQNPTLPLDMDPGQSVDFYSRTVTTCRAKYEPALPSPTFCPAGNPAFSFCQ